MIKATLVTQQIACCSFCHSRGMTYPIYRIVLDEPMMHYDDPDQRRHAISIINGELAVYLNFKIDESCKVVREVMVDDEIYSLVDDWLDVRSQIRGLAEFIQDSWDVKPEDEPPPMVSRFVPTP
jgi:hypothetical protein